MKSLVAINTLLVLSLLSLLDSPSESTQKIEGF